MVVLSSSNTRSRSYGTENGFYTLLLHLYKRSKNVSKCPQNYYFGDVKMNFFFWPPLQTPPPQPTTSASRRPPLSEILNTPLSKRVHGRHVSTCIQFAFTPGDASGYKWIQMDTCIQSRAVFYSWIQMDTSKYMFYSVDTTGYNLYPVVSIQV